MERVPSSTSRMKMQKASHGVRHHLFMSLSQTDVFVFWGGRQLNLSLFTLWLRRDEGLLLQPQPVTQLPKRVFNLSSSSTFKTNVTPHPHMVFQWRSFLSHRDRRVKRFLPVCRMLPHHAQQLMQWCSSVTERQSGSSHVAEHGNRPRCSSLAPS